MAMRSLLQVGLFYFLVLPLPQLIGGAHTSIDSEAEVDDGICYDLDSDESCKLSKDDAHSGNNGGSNRVAPDCTLVMAPSGISNSGWGVFTLTPHNRGQKITNDGDIIIHVPDPNPHHAEKMKRLIWDYLWSGQEAGGHYEGHRVMTAISGFGSLANGANGVSRNPNLLHDIYNYPTVDNAGLKRGVFPGAGAISHHHNFTWTVMEDLDAGDEVFVEFGGNWFEERGYGDVVSHRFSVSHLRKVGYCLDNISPGPSLIKGAGRGAFATRDLEEGHVIAPVPVIPLSRLSMEMSYGNPADGTTLLRTQLLLNYCFGHPKSSLLLYPYSHGVNYINHHSTSPNVRLRWWHGSEAFFEKPMLELQQSGKSQLMLELVATRPLSKGEEIVLDYGRPWEEAWNSHVESWEPGHSDVNRVSAKTMNKDDRFFTLRTWPEQQKRPYPSNVFTSCYYKYYPDGANQSGPSASSNSGPKQSMAKWSPDMILTRNLRPCVVIHKGQGKESNLYGVQVMNRPTLEEVDRIPQGHRHIATHVPRHAILFSDRTYESDQHLGDAFRKEIGLGDLFPEQWKDLL